jgi:hypothetical protein
MTPLMVIPQISLPIAFAIGLPIGVAGYFGQEALLRRRGRKRAAAGGAWGPRSRDGEGGGGAVTSGRPRPPGDASTLVPAQTGQRRGGRGSRSAAAEADVMASAVAELPAPTQADLNERRQRAGAVRNLQRRESSLEAALEEVVGFVEREPRRNRARTCAWALEGMIPKSRRSKELTSFLHDVEGSKSPSTLQEEAEEVGLQLARELKSVKTELRTLTQ